MGRASVEDLAQPAAGADVHVFEPLHHATAYKSVFQRIEQRILSGQLAQGQPLPTELSLARQFGVNRSTVREAIRLLEQEGMIERRAGRRLFASAPGLCELAPRTKRALILHQVSFNELWQVAMVLDPLTARLAAPRAQAADIEELEANLAENLALLKRPPGEAVDFKRVATLDVAFHAVIARICNNRALILAREPMSLLYGPSTEQVQAALPQAGKRNADSHRRILTALRDQNADQAEEGMRKHLVDFRRGYLLSGLAMDAPLTGARATPT